MDLWTHQQAAFDFARVRKATMLNMGLGTGKTLVAIRLAERWESNRIVVVCPLSVCDVWRSELEKWAEPPFNVVIASRGTSDKRRKSLLSPKPSYPTWVIVNYDWARTPTGLRTLRQLSPDLVIADECHRLKAPFGKQSKALHTLGREASVDHRLGLTGTIMPHSPLDAFGQYRFLDVGLLGYSFVAFRRQYAILGGWKKKEVIGYQNIEELRRRMATITYQVDRSVLDLPEPHHHIVEVVLEREARSLYDPLAAGLVGEIEDGTITPTNALVKLLRLQQITSGLVSLDEGGSRWISHAKQDAVEEILDSTSEEPVIVFGRFSCDIAAVQAACDSGGRHCYHLTGERKQIDEWRADPSGVLAAQIQAGGVGVDLTHARVCVYSSTGFNLGDYEQSLARCHRPGQTRGVVYFHLVARDTIDEPTRKALASRKQVVESVLEDLAGART